MISVPEDTRRSLTSVRFELVNDNDNDDDNVLRPQSAEHDLKPAYYVAIQHDPQGFLEQPLIGTYRIMSGVCVVCVRDRQRQRDRETERQRQRQRQRQTERDRNRVEIIDIPCCYTQGIHTLVITAQGVISSGILIPSIDNWWATWESIDWVHQGNQ